MSNLLNTGYDRSEYTLEDKLDNAYSERNRLVALLSVLFPSGISHTDIEGWDDDWKQCVTIDLPCGQASWHFSQEKDGHLFAHLKPYTKDYDGHSTKQKYENIDRYVKEQTADD